METRAFAPLYAPTYTVSGTTTFGLQTASVSVTSTNASATASAQLPGGTPTGFQQILISNTTNAWAYVAFGVVGQITAATVAASLPVAPGTQLVVSVDKEVTGASVILGTAPGTATAVIFTRGEGIG